MSTITLNIGQLTSTGRRMSRAEMEAKLRSVIPAQYITFTKMVNKEQQEPTLVVQAVTASERGAGPGNLGTMYELCGKLQQDCIAYRYDNGSGGYLAGPKTKQYQPFDIDQFVTKEQAMSYSHPSNPARFAVGDVVESIENKHWSGPMTVTEVFPRIIICQHPTLRSGGFEPRDLKHHVPAPASLTLEQRVEKLEQALQCPDVKPQGLPHPLAGFFNVHPKQAETPLPQIDFLPDLVRPAPAPAKEELSADDYQLLVRLVGKHTLGTRAHRLYEKLIAVSGYTHEQSTKSPNFALRDGMPNLG